jgi:hypothetical protein
MIRRTKYGNKKLEINGVKFDSKLESFCYDLLNKLKFEFEFQKKIILIDGFRYNKKAIRPITLTVDFVVKHNDIDYYIDIKGFATDVSKIKYKMLRYQLKDNPKTDVLWLHSQRAILQFLNNLKEEK